MGSSKFVFLLLLFITYNTNATFYVKTGEIYLYELTNYYVQSPDNTDYTKTFAFGVNKLEVPNGSIFSVEIKDLGEENTNLTRLIKLLISYNGQGIEYAFTENDYSFFSDTDWDARISSRLPSASEGVGPNSYLYHNFSYYQSESEFDVISEFYSWEIDENEHNITSFSKDVLIYNKSTGVLVQRIKQSNGTTYEDSISEYIYGSFYEEINYLRLGEKSQRYKIYDQTIFGFVLLLLVLPYKKKY